MPGIRLDRFETGSDDFDDIVLAAFDELGQGGADSSLVVRDQHSHGRTWQKAPRQPANLLVQLLEFCGAIGKVETRMKKWFLVWLLILGAEAANAATPLNPRALQAAAAYSRSAG